MKVDAPYKIMNSYMLGESKQQLTEVVSTKTLFELPANFREVKLKKVKDVSTLEVFRDTLYVGTKDSKVFVYELVKYKKQDQGIELTNERSFYPHCTSVHFIVASSLFLIVVPLEQQQLIRIWNRQTLQILHGYKGHAKQITCVIFLKDKNHIASSSYDGTVRIWKISQNFQFDLQIRKYTSKYPLLSLTEIDNDNVAFGGDDCFINIWNWNKDLLRHRCFAHPGSITSLSFCQPNQLYSIGGDSKIRVWRINEEFHEKSNKNFNQIMLSDVVLPADPKLVLQPIKEFNQQISQNIFTISISNSQILAIDSKGKTFLIERALEVSSSQLELEYTESIKSAKIWQSRLLLVTYRKGKGELKEIKGAFNDIANRAYSSEEKNIFPNTTKIDIHTKHSIAAQNISDGEKIPDHSLVFEP